MVENSEEHPVNTFFSLLEEAAEQYNRMQQKDTRVGSSGSRSGVGRSSGIGGSNGVDEGFRPKEGVSRADFVTLYERDVINVDARDRWMNYIQRGEYLSRSDLRSLSDQGEMYPFIRDTCVEILDGERLKDILRRPASDYSSVGRDSSLGSQQLLLQLRNQVERGEISQREALDLLEEAGFHLPERNSNSGRGSGVGGDPEVERLNEMLDRFQNNG
ncbi:hypothetical protein [Natrinema sp. H-ect4]|uniref:hypothetical protein n=1 Tax=Natrinema sp. H-ect4 TaxID=3242699 RepID=UPI0035A85D96